MMMNSICNHKFPMQHILNFCYLDTLNHSDQLVLLLYLMTSMNMQVSHYTFRKHSSVPYGIQ